jgi:hypothetical protein
MPAYDPYDAYRDPGSGLHPAIPCPENSAVDAGECCGVTATDCCEGMKPTCETSACLDANGDVDVVVCRQWCGCATHPPQDPPTAAEIEADARANEAEWTHAD